MVNCFSFSKLQINILSIFIVCVIVSFSIFSMKKVEKTLISKDLKVVDFAKQDNFVYISENKKELNNIVVDEVTDLNLTWALKIPKIDLIARNYRRYR